MTKVYMRNPYEYIDLLVEANYRTVAWDTGSFVRRRIDPLAFLRLRFGNAQPWELMTLAVEGASIYNEHSRNIDDPIAVYPTWLPEHGFDTLIDLCERPVSEDRRVTNNLFTLKRYRPIVGQAHVIVVYDVLNIGTDEGMNWYRQLRKIIADYPDVQFIVHDTTSFRIMFGGDFDGATINPMHSAFKGELMLPNGSNCQRKDMRKHMPWIKLLGFTMAKIQTHADICRYNIEALRWAADNYAKNVDFRLTFDNDVDVDSPGGAYELRDRGIALFDIRRPVAFKAGDGVLCDACSVAPKCKFYRGGMVCGLSKTEAGKLAQAFGSRDADTILDGLSKIAEIQASRVAEDLEKEAAEGERFPDTDKRLKDLFDSGVKIAKLRKPELNGKGTTVNVGVVGGAAIVQRATPQELIAGAVKALEDRGIPRDQITDGAIIGLLEGVAAHDGAAKIEEIIDAELVE